MNGCRVQSSQIIQFDEVADHYMVFILIFGEPQVKLTEKINSNLVPEY